jgi:hypothetical protein
MGGNFESTKSSLINKYKFNEKKYTNITWYNLLKYSYKKLFIT